jgi:PAS domain S-box-containing protein/diguanylate cyclase (GGDEF)-like protein
MTVSLHIILIERSDDDAQMIMDTVRQGGLVAEFHRITALDELPALLDKGQAELVVTAFCLGEASALEVIELVRGSQCDLPVIVLSDAVGKDMVVPVMHAGAHDLIPKHNLSRLVPAIERELEELTVHRQHKAAVSALQESEQRFRQLTENIGEVLWLIEPEQNRVIYLSPAYEDVWERTGDELRANPESLLETVHPEDYCRIQARLKVDGWAGFNDEYRVVLPDGEVRWVNTRSFPINDEQGKTCRVAGLSKDISHSKQLEEEREIMSRALEQSADAVTITDEQGMIIYVNSAFEDITGYEKSEVLGQSPSILKSGLQDDGFYHQLWQSITQGIPFTDIFINRRKDGELYYEAKTVTPVYSQNGGVTHYVSTGKDITQRLKSRERFHKLLHYDAVTGLANKILLQDRLNQAILQATRRGYGLGVICVGFGLSGLLGAVQGKENAERLLRCVAQRLMEGLDKTSTVARIDNDRFLVLLRNVENREGYEQVAKELVVAFAEPVMAEGYELFLSPSIGISLFPQDADDSEQLIKHAELAMQHARHSGHNNYRFYQAGLECKPRSLLS